MSHVGEYQVRSAGNIYSILTQDAACVESTSGGTSDVITKVVHVVKTFLILTSSRNFLCEVVSIPVVTGLVVACPNLIFSSLVCVRAMVRFGQAKGMFCNGGKCRQITIVKYRGESRDKKITAATLVFSPRTYDRQ